MSVRKTNPLVSVLSPHYQGTNPYIADTYDSLKQQTYKQWQWCITLNNGGILPKGATKDSRINVTQERGTAGGIGYYKRRCAEISQGTILVELDADDLLLPHALERIVDTFQMDSETEAVRANSVEFNSDTWEPSTYDSYFGWRYRDIEYEGHLLKESILPAIDPQSLHFLERWTANARAWKAETYWKIGGHDPCLAIGEDGDLTFRLYNDGAKFALIDEGLALYRRHEHSSSIQKKEAIQEVWLASYHKYIEGILHRWCQEQGLGEGTINGDAAIFGLGEGLPLEDNVMGYFYVWDCLHRTPDLVGSMNELYRILAPGGFLRATVLAHDAENFFKYYTTQEGARMVPRSQARFVLSNIYYQGEWANVMLITAKPGIEIQGGNPWA